MIKIAHISGRPLIVERDDIYILIIFLTRAMSFFCVFTSTCTYIYIYVYVQHLCFSLSFMNIIIIIIFDHYLLSPSFRRQSCKQFYSVSPSKQQPLNRQGLRFFSTTGMVRDKKSVPFSQFEKEQVRCHFFFCYYSHCYCRNLRIVAHCKSFFSFSFTSQILSCSSTTTRSSRIYIL